MSLDPVERGKVGASVELLRGILVEDGGGGGGSRVQRHGRVGGGDSGKCGQHLAFLYSHHNLKSRTTLLFPRLLHLSIRSGLSDNRGRVVTQLLIIIIVLVEPKMAPVPNYPGMLPRHLQSGRSSASTLVVVQPRTHLLRCVHAQNRRSS